MKRTGKGNTSIQRRWQVLRRIWTNWALRRRSPLAIRRKLKEEEDEASPGFLISFSLLLLGFGSVTPVQEMLPDRIGSGPEPDQDRCPRGQPCGDPIATRSSPVPPSTVPSRFLSSSSAFTSPANRLQTRMPVSLPLLEFPGSGKFLGRSTA